MVISLAFWLGPMTPAAPIPPIETVRLPFGAEVGGGILTITLCRPGSAERRPGPGEGYWVDPPPALSGVWSLAGPLMSTDRRVSKHIATVWCLNGFVLERLPPSDRTCFGVFRSRW